MRMSQKRLEFGSNLMDELEEGLKKLDPETSGLDLEATIEYMEYIRLKMLVQYHMQPNEEISTQIHRMTNCISSVRKLLENQDASAM